MVHHVRNVLATLLISSVCALGAAKDSTIAEVKVRVTDQGACEVGGYSVSCDSVGSKVLSLCPKARCRVLVDPDVGSDSEAVVAAFKSLVREHFSEVSIRSRTER
jgi:hypothetical protein